MGDVQASVRRTEYKGSTRTERDDQRERPGFTMPCVRACATRLICLRCRRIVCPARTRPLLLCCAALCYDLRESFQSGWGCVGENDQGGASVRLLVKRAVAAQYYAKQYSAHCVIQSTAPCVGTGKHGGVVDARLHAAVQRAAALLQERQRERKRETRRGLAGMLHGGGSLS